MKYVFKFNREYVVVVTSRDRSSVSYRDRIGNTHWGSVANFEHNFKPITIDDYLVAIST